MTTLAKKRKILKAIKDSAGIVSQIAKKSKASRTTVYEYLKVYPDVKEAYEDEKEKVLDIAETSLYQLAQQKDIQAVKYILDKKGEGRGYGAPLQNINLYTPKGVQIEHKETAKLYSDAMENIEKDNKND
jgi:predicted transcriptional regulator YheO